MRSVPMLVISETEYESAQRNTLTDLLTKRQATSKSPNGVAAAKRAERRIGANSFRMMAHAVSAADMITAKEFAATAASPPPEQAATYRGLATTYLKNV